MAFTRVILSQNDPRWRNKFLGFSEKFTIGTDGCAITCLAIVAAGFGYSSNPDEVNELIKEKGGFEGLLMPDGSKEKILVVWGSFDQRYDQVSMVRYWAARERPIPFGDLDAGLARGWVAVVQIDRDPNKEGIQSHFVVIYEKSGEDYLILDPLSLPNDMQEVTLNGRYSKGRSLSEFVNCVLMYRGPNFQPHETLPNDQLLRVRVPAYVTKSLRLRSTPEKTDNVLAMEKAGAVLHVLEPIEGAILKIGIQDQWLKVSDSYGQTGFVDAQYVEFIGQNSIAPGDGLPTEILYVVVPLYVTEGLHLRSQPVISPATKIKILTAGIQLRVLESVDGALAKVGTPDQWLYVVDPEGKIGYVMAEFVERINISQPGTEGTPPGEGDLEAGLTVRVRSDAETLCLRSEPVKSPDNLLAFEAAGTHLLVKESIAGAQAKIGDPNKWLLVTDPAERTGYVNARYVELITPP